MTKSDAEEARKTADMALGQIRFFAMACVYIICYTLTVLAAGGAPAAAAGGAGDFLPRNQKLNLQPNWISRFAKSEV